MNYEFVGAGIKSQGVVLPLSSLHFLFTLPLILLVFWGVPGRWQRMVLLIASLIVYLYAGWSDLLLLVGTTAANWAIHRLWPSSRLVRAVGVAINILILVWFKYRIFLGLDSGGSLVIPLGISFYIFQLIAYQVEIAKGYFHAVPKFNAFFLYIFFFPHHQAGPIMRPSRFIRCFESPRQWFNSRFISGLLILAWGLFKKIWIADLIANTVDRQYAILRSSGGSNGNLPFLAVTYGIQIYTDFSGYSDIALGIGRLFGFKLDRNFHQPYLASNPREFWGRWHITLSQWLRDHLYIPLGGNRFGTFITGVNLMVVMLIGGLWHGASWSFVLWGGLHGGMLVLNNLFQGKWTMPRWVALPLFQGFVSLTWLPFRAERLSDLMAAGHRMGAWFGALTIASIFLLIGIIGFSYIEEQLEHFFPRMLRLLTTCSTAVFLPVYSILLYLILIGVGNVTTFIYQRF